MNFYQLQQDLAKQDQEDNEILKKILKEYQELKSKYGEALDEISKKDQSISQLKNENDKLYQEILFLKSNSSTSQKTNHKNHEVNDPYHHPQSYYPIYSHPLPIYNHKNDIQSNILTSQITKRRIINGFVGQLTQQLQFSEQILLKERKMQQQIKRDLILIKQQLQQSKHRQKLMQNQLNLLLFENNELKKQIQCVHRDKNNVEKNIKNDLLCIKNRYNMFNSEIDNELLYMDEVYHQIQLQLTNS